MIYHTKFWYDQLADKVIHLAQLCHILLQLWELRDYLDLDNFFKNKTQQINKLRGTP